MRRSTASGTNRVESEYVVDTSVFVRWFLRQTGWQQARTYRNDYISGEIGLHTMECARFELPHVLRTKGLLAGKLTAEEFWAAVRMIDDLGIAVEPMSVDTLEQAAQLAVEANLRFFDAVFLHRSLASGLMLLTADLALAHSAERLAVDVKLVTDP